jgi:tripartite-type tricarboxylate transporter receptor subunit TctC
MMAVLAFGLVMISHGAFASEEKFPSKSINAIVPYAAGGGTDLLARAVMRVWQKYSPQPWVVINKPGGGGVVGTEGVVRSKPDGYTIYVGYGSGNDTVLPHLQKLPYDPSKDLVPLARLSSHALVLVTGAASPYKTLPEMVAWAKKENKPFTASIPIRAGVNDITITALGKMVGVKIVTVPFSGAAESVTALAGGHVMIGSGNPSEVMPHIKAGRFRALAVATPERDPSLPNTPTLKEVGVDIPWGTILKGVGAPLGTPKEVIAYYETTLKKVCEDQEFKKIMATLYQPILYQNSADFGRFFEETTAEYGKLLKDLNITLQ